MAVLVEVGLRLLAVRRALRRGRLGELVENMRTGKVRMNQKIESAECVAVQHVDRFLAARRFAPTEPSCLLDSFALAGFLARRGSRPTMVFGVKLDPFAAHCWLQDRRQILNDTHENAAAFTPILAI